MNGGRQLFEFVLVTDNPEGRPDELKVQYPFRERDKDGAVQWNFVAKARVRPCPAGFSRQFIAGGYAMPSAADSTTSPFQRTP